MRENSSEFSLFRIGMNIAYNPTVQGPPERKKIPKLIYLEFPLIKLVFIRAPD